MDRVCLRPDQVRALGAALDQVDQELNLEDRVWVWQDQWGCVFVQRAAARESRPDVLDLQDPVPVRA